MTVEELQIIISVKTEEVRNKISKLKETIASVQPKKAANVDVSTNKAQGNLKKLQAEIDRTQVKIDKLNQKMAGVYAKQDAIVNQYSGVPNLSGMSHDQTIDFTVGQDPKMQELNAQLEHLEAETAPLKTHLAETKAQISAAGNAAEPAAAKTRRLGESMRMAGNHIQNAGRSSRFFGRMVKSMLLYRGISFIAQSISEGIQNMALSSAQANSTMSQLATSTLYLKNSIAAGLMPALQALTPVINQVADALASVFNTIAMLTARIFNHASTVTIAQRANVNYAATLSGTGTKAKQATAAVKELQRTVMGFDELNVLNKPEDTKSPINSGADASGAKPGMPIAGQMFKTVQIPPWINNIGNVTDQVGKVINDWWSALTDAQKWGAGIGGTAGFIIGGIIGRLIGGPIGKVVGSVLGGAAGVAIGVWWESLTTPEKWSAGIGAGAGIVIGGIIGGLIGGKIGAAVGAVLGGVAGALIGKWWADLTTPEKWAVGIGAGAGTVIGGMIGGMIGGPIGVVVGAALGGTAGTVIGKWWADLTAKDKWAVGIGATAGVVIGGIIGTLICPGLGTVLGAALGGVAGGLIGKWWSTLTSKQKWSVGTSGIGAIIGGIIGGIFLGPLGIILGAGIGGLAGNMIEKFWDYLSNKNHWKIGKGVGIAVTMGAIIGGIIGGPLGMAIGAAIAGGTTFAVGKLVNKHAKGTLNHPGGPALVNDAPGSAYRELVQYPNGRFFIPDGRNVLIPNLPAGSKVLPAQQTRMLFPHYKNGVGKFGFEKAIVSPVNQGAGIADIFADGDILSGSIGQNQNSSSSDATNRIISRMDKMEQALKNLKICLYTNDRKIAESANRGNTSIDRCYHPIART